MAKVRLGQTVRVDLSPFYDAVSELVGAHDALAHRHGERFRILERDIEDALEQMRPQDLGDADLGDGEVVITPPTAVTALLRRSRELGVI